MLSSRPALAAAVCLTLASPAAAGQFGVFADAGYFHLNATQSASALFDSTGGPTYGGALRFTLGSGLYFEAGARYFAQDGRRVLVTDPAGPVYKLDYPVHIRLVPVYGSVGWRFGHHALIPYLAIGGGVTSFDETDEVVGITSTASQTKGSAHGLLGVEYGWGSLRVAAEARYETVPNAIGMGGVAKVYGETDLGGLSVVGRVGYVFGHQKAKP
jgi:hypothetical protein